VTVTLTFEVVVVVEPDHCDDCGSVLCVGEIILLCDHGQCGHEVAYCGQCAVWRALKSDALGETEGLTSWWLESSTATA
jgi:hypothetical protein